MSILFVPTGVCNPNDDLSCLLLITDVNGFKKPNRLGKDIYIFASMVDRVTPLPDGSDCDATVVGEGGVGLTCSYKYLIEGK